MLGSHTDFCTDHSKCERVVVWTKVQDVWIECHGCEMKADGYWVNQEWRNGELHGPELHLCLLCSKMHREVAQRVV